VETGIYLFVPHDGSERLYAIIQNAHRQKRVRFLKLNCTKSGGTGRECNAFVSVTRFLERGRFIPMVPVEDRLPRFSITGRELAQPYYESVDSGSGLGIWRGHAGGGDIHTRLDGERRGVGIQGLHINGRDDIRDGGAGVHHNGVRAGEHELSVAILRDGVQLSGRESAEQHLDEHTG